MRWVGLTLASALGACATPGSAVPPEPTTPRPTPVIVGMALTESSLVLDALRGFLAAAEAGRFDEAHTFLAAPLRERYTPDRLKADFELEPLAKERLARARRALTGTPVIDGAVARLPLDNGRALRTVREDRGWKIAALEE